jgi:hypothetical protein
MQKTIGVTGSVAEIGVYKGRFLIALALTLEGEFMTGRWPSFR